MKYKKHKEYIKLDVLQLFYYFYSSKLDAEKLNYYAHTLSVEKIAWYCKQAFLYEDKKQITEEYNPVSSVDIQNYPNITCEYSFLIHPILDYILWAKMGRNGDPGEMNPYKYNFKKIVLSLLSSDELFVFVKGMLKRIMAYSDNSKDKVICLDDDVCQAEQLYLKICLFQKKTRYNILKGNSYITPFSKIANGDTIKYRENLLHIFIPHLQTLQLLESKYVQYYLYNKKGQPQIIIPLELEGQDNVLDIYEQVIGAVRGLDIPPKQSVSIVIDLLNWLAEEDISILDLRFSDEELKETEQEINQFEKESKTIDWNDIDKKLFAQKM